MKFLMILLIFLTTSNLLAFSIGEVKIQPTYPITDDQDVVISVQIITAARPAFLRKPTEIVRDRNMSTITIYPDMGTSSTLSYTNETINLGRLGVGTNLFVIKLQPPDDYVGGPFQIVGGNIMIYPKLRIRKIKDMIEFRWPATGAGPSFYLESSNELGEKANWKITIQSAHESGPDELMTLPATAAQGYYRLRQREPFF